MDVRALAMGLIFAFIWASAFTSARVIVTYAPPIFALALRFWISGLIGIAIAKAVGQSWKLTRNQWMAVIVFGICQNTLYLGLNFVSMQWIEASLASIIAATMPLLVALLGWVVLSDKVAPLGVVGLVLGFIGVGIIMAGRFEGEASALGILLCCLGALSLAIATLVMRGASTGGNLMMIVGLQMLVAAALLTVVAPLVETWSVEWNWQLGVSFAYTVFVPGLLATWVWFVLVQRIGAVKAATYHFLTPVFGVAVAAFFLGERMGWIDMVGVAVVAAGILMVQLARQVR